MTAVSRFHLLLSSAQGIGDPDFDGALLALLQETQEKLKAASPSDQDFFVSVVEQVGSIPGTKGAPSRIQCLLNATQYFYVTGNPLESLDPALQAMALARSIGNDVLLRKALVVAGIVSADSGDCSQAIQWYADALDLAIAQKDAEAECVVWTNLGVAFKLIAQYQQAMDCYERALEIIDRHPSLIRHAPTTLSNMAVCALHTEDFARGLEVAERSIALSSDPKTATEMLTRVMQENNYARLLLEVDNLPKAKERCDLAADFAVRSQSARADIASHIMRGLYDVHAGNLDLGLSRLNSALERARQMRSMLREALIALVKAHEIIGQPERALVYLKELIEETRKGQQAKVLAHHRQHLERVARRRDLDLGNTTLAKRQAQLREQVAQKELIRKEAETELVYAEKDRMRRELFKSRIEILERMAVTAELRDDSTGEHSYRVGKLASLLAQEFGCEEDTCYMMDIAARLHDIGKIGVPDAVLLKPGRLNEPELMVMRSHPTIGAELLSKSDTPHMQMAEEIARYHHEWWDGTGYPGGLSGTGIPLAARITALADVFDALTHKRPYKEAWTIEDALAEIVRLGGVQFDPHLTDLFVELVKRLQTEHANLDTFLGQAANAMPFHQARARIQDALRKGVDPGDDTGPGSRLDLQR